MNEHGYDGTPPGPPPLPRRNLHAPAWPRVPASSLPAALLIAALLIGPLWFWFFCRIEPESGQIAVLIRKTGENLASGQIIATKPGQKGIQLAVLAEGRYFRNPYTWGWEFAPITDIPAGRLGVQTRLYGEDLPPGKIIAGENTKGLMAEVLGPGKYRVNPYAVHVQIADAITIRPGGVGVMTSLVGADVLDGAGLPAAQRNTFLVGEGLKGVVTNVLDPGTYYLNPYMVNVVEVNLQSQRFEMSGDDAITFLTVDGFTVTVEGTIEYALTRDHAALLTHRVGDMDDIIKKLILPRARGFSRIEGSKNPAINYIVGETRQKFQDSLDAHLREQLAPEGVTIKSVLIRNIKTPDEIASIIRDREVAVQDAKKYEQQIEQAKSKAELTKQEMLALQSKAKVEADTARIRAVIQAQQQMSVKLTVATQEWTVATLENDAATFQAQAVVRKAEAEGGVIRMDNLAQAAVISNQVAAFTTGQNYARYVFYQQIAPKIATMLTSDDPTGFGGLLTPFLPVAPGSAAPPLRERKIPVIPPRESPPPAPPAAVEKKEVAP